MTPSAFPHPVEILKNLSEAFGPSGHEDDVRAYITQLITPLVDSIREDALGNLIAVRAGKTPRRLMLDAHTDEVGVMVRHIDDNGFMKFAKLGGWDDRLFPAHRVKLRSRTGSYYFGVIGMAPPHVLTEDARKKVIASDDLFIDIGATSAQDAMARGVAVGDPGVLEYPFMEFAPQHFVGKAFDDRAGCALLICLLNEIAAGRVATPMEIHANFATSEELGLRGAHTAAFGIDPEIALAFEGTIGSDFPGVPADRRVCSQRQGPVISVIDNSLMVRRKMTDLMFKAATDLGIPHQVKMPIFGGTDAGAIHQSRAGVLAGVISVPCRYIHSPNSTLFWPDFEASLLLAGEVVRRVHTLLT
jgi:endoglucanase